MATVAAASIRPSEPTARCQRVPGRCEATAGAVRCGGEGQEYGVQWNTGPGAAGHRGIQVEVESDCVAALTEKRQM